MNGYMSKQLTRGSPPVPLRDAARLKVSAHMSDIPDRATLLLSLQRALLGEVHAALRQASIEVDPICLVIRLRFEYDGVPSDDVQDSCSSVAAEVISDFPAPWRLDEQHLVNSCPAALAPLAHVAYRRAEPR